MKKRANSPFVKKFDVSRNALVERLIPDVVEPDVDAGHESCVGALIDGQAVIKGRPCAAA